MPTNHYFNLYGNKSEQRLVEDLLIEAIKQFGFDGYYIPNDNVSARDLLYGEDPIKKFRAAYMVELYVNSNPLDYLGQKELYTKFGLEIKDNVILKGKAIVILESEFDDD